MSVPKEGIMLESWDRPPLIPTNIQTGWGPGVIIIQLMAADGTVFAQGQMTPVALQKYVDGLLAAKAQAERPRH